MSSSLDATTGPLPSYLLGLKALALAVVSVDGRVTEANAGFYRWIGVADLGPAASVAQHFLNPTFETFLLQPAEGETKVFEGIMTVGDENSSGRSSNGEVHRYGDRLLILAEPDIEQLEALADRVMELNDELSTRQRDLATAMRKLERREQQLEKLGSTDPLTQLPNRRGFDTWFAREVEFSQDESLPLTLMFLDLDHFKEVNDTFGHVLGDEVLRAFARVLKQTTRDHDILARTGGEEFVVVCPGMDGEASAAAAKRILEAVRELRVPGLDHPITVSIGLATGIPSSPREFLRRADAALYDAKRAGRDRVAVRREPLTGGLGEERRGT